MNVRQRNGSGRVCKVREAWQYVGSGRLAAVATVCSETLQVNQYEVAEPPTTCLGCLANEGESNGT